MNTRDELKGIAEILNNVDKKNSYRVPEGYFDSLNVNIRHKLDIKTNEDTVPQDYFNRLPDVVMQKVKEESNVIHLNPIKGVAKYIGVAASLVILFWVGNVILQPVEGPETNVEMDFLDYLSENINEVEAISLWNLDILDESNTIDELNVFDDLMLDYYLERNLDDIELAYLEEIIDY